MKLGIVIPYYRNSTQCEINFRLLMDVLEKQIYDRDDTLLVVVEDGQCSGWLEDYKSDSIVVISNLINMGVSHTRNVGLSYVINRGCEYVLFIDSDDMIDSNCIFKIMDRLYTSDFDIYEMHYFINNVMKEYRINDIRSSACGSIIRCDLIGNLRFKVNLQIGEDTLFMKQLFDRNGVLSKCDVNTNYYYNLGSNLNSLTMRHLRHEIGIERSDDNEMS